MMPPTAPPHRRLDRSLALSLALLALAMAPVTRAAPELLLASLDGSNGVRLDGAAAQDQSGTAVAAAGDFNGDGIADLIVGAPGSAGGGLASGGAYVVFGRNDSSFAPTLALSSLDGSNGVRLDGAPSDLIGRVVAGLGDVNGDGVDDVIVGSDSAGSDSGRSYVVFGRGGPGFGPSLALSSLDGSDGFRIDGLDTNDFSSASVSGAGDLNQDGAADLIIGAPHAGAGSFRPPVGWC